MLKDLQGVIDYVGLAKRIGLEPNEMLKDLYGKASGYSEFFIPKKSGGFRKIEAPQKTRRIVQCFAKQLLESVYRRPEPVHGFVSGRSVLSNARPHIGKRTTVNVDIESFYQSIAFQRVRGIFLSAPLGLSWTVGNILAHACCCEKHLATGGIASPIISNIILSGLDKKLLSLTNRYGGNFTRYCDDLTFSFQVPPKRLSAFVSVNADGWYEPSSVLDSLIRDHGFLINKQKFHVATGASRKTVTGITVNRRPNLRREWIRALDCTMYACEKFGIEKVAAERFPSLTGYAAKFALFRHLHGKICYLSMIRGRYDWIAADFGRRFNALSGSTNALRLPEIELVSTNARLARALWVVTGHSNEDLGAGIWGNQGTGFTCVGGLIFTADHVITDDSGKPYPHIMIRRALNSHTMYSCEVVARSPISDVAILRAVAPLGETRIRFGVGQVDEAGTNAHTIGYPNWYFGHRETSQDHKILSVRPRHGISIIEIDGIVQGGLSGAPLFDDQYRVIGFVHRGILGANVAHDDLARANEGIAMMHALDLLKGDGKGDF